MVSSRPNLGTSPDMAIWGWLGAGAAIAGAYVFVFSLAITAHRADVATERAVREHWRRRGRRNAVV